MKKLLSWILVIVMLASLCACGVVGKDDNGFTINLKRGLEKRFAKAEKMPGSYTSNSAEKNDRLELINIEKDAIGNLQEYVFMDSGLEQLAEQYVAALDSQIEGLKYLGNNDDEFHKLYYQDGYYTRASVISKLVSDYGFQLNSKYSNYMNDLLDDGDLYTRERDAMQALEDMISKGVVLKAENMYDVSAPLVNTSNMDLSGISVNLLLVDSTGAVLESSMDYFESWRAGETKMFKPYIFQGADRYQVSFSYYSTATGIEWTTTPKDVDYQAFDPGVEFILCSELPSDYTPSSWYSRATCHVTDFWTELTYSEAGKSSFTLHVAGSKTYDVKGNDYSRSCHFEYRITNEDQSIVYSTGTFYTDELKVGQSFADCTSYVSDLAPGTYYVEFYSGKY